MTRLRALRIPTAVGAWLLSAATGLGPGRRQLHPATHPRRGQHARRKHRRAAGAAYVPPTGPPPRLPNGKVDFSGVWDHAYVPDMARTSAANPALQTGPGELPYTPAGLKNIEAYDPERDGDYTGMCMPFGFTRSMNSP